MKPLVIVWRVTGRCNLSCAFCAYDRTQNISRRHTDESLVRQFAEFAASLGRPVLFSWLGGEPLLWPALTQLTRDLRQRHGFAISTTTNGTTLHREEVRQHLIDHYSELTISLDGPAIVHDALRGQNGLFAQIEHAVRQLAGHGPLLRMNTVLMRHTIAHFPALCREVAAWGIREITCNQLGGIERPEFYPANRLLPEQVATLTTLWPDLHAELAAQGVRLLGGEGYLHRLAASARDEKLPIENCDPGRDYLFVTEDGIASPCSFTTADYGIDLRTLTSTAQLADLPPEFSRRRLARRATACQDCHSTQVCAKFT